MEQSPQLTLKQKRVLDFIRQRLAQHLPPTIREIGKALGVSSTGTVRDYLRVLERKGYLKRARNLSRSMELLREKPRQIPIIASIAAGKPNLTYEDIEGYIDPDDLFLGRLSYDDVFALKVKGESMKEAGIMEGDIAVIKKQPTANESDVIAALLEHSEATLKRLRFKGKRPYLEPANKQYAPIYKDFAIIGKVIAVIRKYR